MHPQDNRARPPVTSACRCGSGPVAAGGLHLHGGRNLAGAITIHRPGTIPPPARPLPAQALPAPRNGPYAGTATLLVNPGRRNPCRATVPITGFVVSGNRVAFRGSRGVIDPSGRLDMQAGHHFVSGQFVGARFEGRWWQPPPACAYSLTLEPVG